MRYKLFLFLVLICAPAYAHAQAALTPEQAQAISACVGPLSVSFQNHTLSLEEFQSDSINCYRSAGVVDLIPAGYRTATSSAQVSALNDAADKAINTLWNSSDALRLHIPDVQSQLTKIVVSNDDAQKINSCFEKLTPEIRGRTMPDPTMQRAIAECYRGTPYEQLLTPLYTKIAVVVECGRDKLGVERLHDVTRLVASPSEKESAIISKCYIERTAPAISAVMIANIVAVGGVRDVGLLIIMSVSNLWLIIRRRRGDKFGTVVNSLAKLPVDLAIVRLSDSASKRVMHSAVTDRNGRFYMFASAGNYDVEVVKPGYIFPAQFGGSALSDVMHGDLLLEPRITINETTPVIQNAVPMDPIVQEPSVPRETWRRVGHRASSFVALASPLVGIGSVVLSPKWWVIILAAINILLFFVFRYFAARFKPHAYGVITNADGKPVAQAIVRVFDTQYNKLVGTAVSDGAGRYGCMAGAGTYTLHGEKNGVGTAEKNIVVPRGAQVIAESIQLKNLPR